MVGHDSWPQTAKRRQWSGLWSTAVVVQKLLAFVLQPGQQDLGGCLRSPQFCQSAQVRMYFAREKNIQWYFRNQTDETAFWLKRMCKITIIAWQNKQKCWLQQRLMLQFSQGRKHLKNISIFTHIHLSTVVNRLVSWQFKYLNLINFKGFAGTRTKLLSVEKKSIWFDLQKEWQISSCRFCWTVAWKHVWKCYLKQ